MSESSEERRPAKGQKKRPTPNAKLTPAPKKKRRTKDEAWGEDPIKRS